MYTIQIFLTFFVLLATPWIGEPRPDQWWIDRHNGFVQNTINNGNKYNVVFYGDSITEGWGGEGAPVFQEKYEPLGTANYGIGGDRCEHLLWRIDDGEVQSNLQPKLVVLKIGTNNGEYLFVLGKTFDCMFSYFCPS